MMSTYMWRNALMAPPALQDSSSRPSWLSERVIPRLPQPCGWHRGAQASGMASQICTPSLGAPPCRPHGSHQRGAGCRQGLGALLQQPHLGSFKAVVGGCETHAGLSAKLDVACKSTGLTAAPSPPGRWRPEDGTASLSPSRSWLKAARSIARACLETPAVPKHTQPCCSPQTKTGTTAPRSGLRRGEICPNTLAVLMHHPTQTGAFCSLQWGQWWAQGKMGAGGKDVPWNWGTLCHQPWDGTNRANFKLKQH